MTLRVRDGGKAFNLAELVGTHLEGTPAGETWRQMLTADPFFYRSPFSQQLRAEGQARSVLRVLDTRGIAITTERRAEVENCIDAELLDAWLDRALTATTAAEVFDAD